MSSAEPQKKSHRLMFDISIPKYTIVRSGLCRWAGASAVVSLVLLPVFISNGILHEKF